MDVRAPVLWQAAASVKPKSFAKATPASCTCCLYVAMHEARRLIVRGYRVGVQQSHSYVHSCSVLADPDPILRLRVGSSGLVREQLFCLACWCWCFRNSRCFFEKAAPACRSRKRHFTAPLLATKKGLHVACQFLSLFFPVWHTAVLGNGTIPRVVRCSTYIRQLLQALPFEWCWNSCSWTRSLNTPND